MDIPNLTSPSTTPLSSLPPSPTKKSNIVYILAIVLAITVGFWLSRFSSVKPSGVSSDNLAGNVVPAEEISQKENIKAGIVYGDNAANFKDTASGVIKKGGINGEGTHTLERAGGASQNASLTSSTLDLDLFVDRKVEVRGETNASNKSGWLLDVGSIKVLE